eukprot:jgi/Mesen1/3653/ME000200S02729
MSGSVGQAMVRFLAALESDESLSASQWHFYGPMLVSSLYSSGEVRLECHFHPSSGAGPGSGSRFGTGRRKLHEGYRHHRFHRHHRLHRHNAVERLGRHAKLDAAAAAAAAAEAAEPPEFTSPAYFERGPRDFHEHYVVLLCPAPGGVPADNGTGTTGEGGAALPGEDGGQADVGRQTSGGPLGEDTLAHAGRFEVQLVATLAGSELRIGRIQLCRCDHDTVAKPFVTLLRDPPLPTQPAPEEGQQQQPQGDAGSSQAQLLPMMDDQGQPALPSFEISGHTVERRTLYYYPRSPAVAAESARGRHAQQFAESGSGVGEARFSSSSWIHQSAAGTAAAGAGETGQAGVRCQVSVCLYPFMSARPFTTESADKAFSEARIIEWIDAHLLAGVDHIYFPDRNFRLRQRLMRPYVDRGQLLHLPFPDWSEVFYRLPYKNSSEPYTFPLIYDQILSVEYCGILGRRYGDTWQFYTDLDEFLTVAHPERGSLKRQLASTVARVEAERGHKLVLLSILRFNFVGVTDETRLEPVLAYSTRCKRPVFQGQGLLDKLAANPSLMIPFTLLVHYSKDVPGKYHYDVPEEVIRIYHYTSNAIDMKRHPCELVRDNDKEMVEDTRATAWTAQVAWCRALPCEAEDIPTHCLPFCSLSSRHERTKYVLELQS